MPEFDVITDLGIELKREIPKGQARMKWLRTDKGYREAFGATPAGLHRQRARPCMSDLSFGEIRLPLKVERPDDLTEEHWVDKNLPQSPNRAVCAVRPVR